LRLVESSAAYLVLIGVGALDIWLLYRFFSHQLAIPEAAAARNREYTEYESIRARSG